MTLDYAALPLRTLKPGTVLRAATPHSGERLTLDSRALSVMTDFAIDHAQRVLGIITASDVLGERPMQIALEHQVKHHEVPVRAVMTPLDRMEALPIDALIDAKIGHVVATLRKAGRQHALVVERGAAGEAVRGIFSVTQIASDLGISIEASTVAGTVAEVEAALVR